MLRPLPALVLLPLLAACGPKGELVRYTIDAQINDVPDWFDPTSSGVVLELPPCNNAEVFDQTLRVYDGTVGDAVAAIQIRWSGVDLSGGGENVETFFLAKGETLPVYAALKPDLVLYEVDHKGNLLQVDKDAAKVSSKKEADASYTLGEGDGVAITELHTRAKEEDVVEFIEQAEVWACDSTQL